MDEFVEADEEYDEGDGGYGERKRSGRLGEKQMRAQQEAKDANSRARRQANRGSVSQRTEPKSRATRNSQKADASFEGDEHDETQSDTDDDDLDLHDEEEDEDGVVVPRTLRRKKQVNYYTLPPLEAPPEKKNKKGKHRADDPFSGLPANLTGAQWAELYPDKAAQGDSVRLLFSCWSLRFA